MAERPRSMAKTIIGSLFLLAALALGGYYGFTTWQYHTMHVTTDNAYIQADMAAITPRVPGTVAEVPVQENWWVKPGQVLVQLDPRDYEVQLANAQAALMHAKESVNQLFAAVAVADERTSATHAQIQAAQAEVAAAQAELRWAEVDFRRATQLVEEKVVPVQRLDRAKTQYEAVRARVQAKQQQLEEAKKNATTRVRELEQARTALGVASTNERTAHSLVKRAEASVREAELNVSYCTVVAPIEGIVSRKAIEVGQRVQPGQPLMAIVPLHKVYIEANYKETQLTEVRIGQPAEIRTDIYPEHIFHGKVESLSAGTGAAFSLLPPENATGNWVKVVQRLPVKIVFDEAPPPELPLRVGLSVEVAINITDRQGTRLQAFSQDGASLKSNASPASTGTAVHLQPGSPTP